LAGSGGSADDEWSPRPFPPCQFKKAKQSGDAFIQQCCRKAAVKRLLVYQSDSEAGSRNDDLETDDEQRRLMMSKFQDRCAYLPRAMRLPRAAGYIGVSPATFKRLVAARRLPCGTRVPGSRIRLWDRLELEGVIENWKDEEEMALRKCLGLKSLL
jgi:hypothetical protein